MPAAFAFAALAVVVVHVIAPRQALALGLAAATLAAVIVRMSVALADHMNLLAASRLEALTDALTGLGNRRSLMLQLEAEVAAATEAEPRAVMLFDLDGFKQYNDWHGHPAGDALLSAARRTAGRGRRAERERVPARRRRVLRSRGLSRGRGEQHPQRLGRGPDGP